MTDRLLSVPEIIASLEQQLAVHREQEDVSWRGGRGLKSPNGAQA